MQENRRWERGQRGTGGRGGLKEGRGGGGKRGEEEARRTGRRIWKLTENMKRKRGMKNTKENENWELMTRKRQERGWNSEAEDFVLIVSRNVSRALRRITIVFLFVYYHCYLYN